ncbi:MAG TPA: hypothetical protein PKN30_10150 [Flavobacteriales bacterium]|nr:hypothetical protein [Flavobacteriales bacterium]
MFHIVLVIPLVATAQPGSSVVDARIDTNVIRIGEQVRLQLEVSHPEAVSVIWPAIGDTLATHIEVVRDSGVDTAEATPGSMRQVRTLHLTAFDTGYWAIPPFRFIVNGAPQETKAMLVEVRTVDVDASKPIRDIKDIVELPFSLLYWIRMHALWLLVALATIGSLIGLLLYLTRRKSTIPVMTEAVALPLTDRVLAGLRSLEAERIWQRGDHKQYQSRLTDLLRGYIEERYRVPAMESTTDELLRELRVSPLNTDQRGRLENMLRLADMVKFAKALPSPQENEQMMASAVQFVRETAPRPEPVGHA